MNNAVVNGTLTSATLNDGILNTPAPAGNAVSVVFITYLPYRFGTSTIYIVDIYNARG
jgi:hypothetical protein